MPQALVFEDPTKAPGTHVLIVGVGRYPHLQGGGGVPALAIEGLRQLEAPPRSALLLATWFLEEFRHPETPLRSLQLLVSAPAPPQFAWEASADGRRSVVSVPPASHQFHDPREDWAVAGADYAAFEAAAKHWYARGDESSGNQLVFFFCGHGLGEKGDVALLLQDFVNGDHGLQGMLDLRRFRLGMRRCRARKQVWLVDACRTPSQTVQAAEDYLGETPIRPGLGAPTAPLNSPVFNSTLQGSRAFGVPNGATLFTDALLGALRGGGAFDLTGDGRWHLTPAVLHQALGVPVRLAARKFGELQIPASESLTEEYSIHEYELPPRVPAYFACAPEIATADAALACEALAGGARVLREAQASDPWRVDLAIGRYRVSASFPPDVPWRGSSREVDIRPPTREYPLEVTHGGA